MDMTLEQIITQGGPVGFALLFAYLWLRSEKIAETLYKKIDALQDEIKQKYTDDLTFYRELESRSSSND